MPTRPITGPLTRSPSGGVTGVGVGGFSVGSLFSSGQDGVVYELGDLSTIYQDASGTTAGAVGQADGLTLDKRLGLVRGANVFSDAAVSLNGEASRLSPDLYNIKDLDGTSDWIAVATPAASVSYEVVYEITRNGAGTLKIDGGVDSIIAPIPSTVGTHKLILTRSALGNGFNITRNTPSGTDVDIRILSVREIPGNHARQTTTANKPTLQLGYAAFDRFDDFMTVVAGGGGTTGVLLCAGIRAGGPGTARTIWSDAGTNTGYKLTLNASNQLVLSAGNGSAYTSVTGPTITAGTDYVVQAWHNGASLSVRVGLAAATSAAFATATAGTAGFTIGRDNGAATGYYGDRIYCLAYRKNDASTAAERDSLARWAASKSNVTL